MDEMNDSERKAQCILTGAWLLGSIRDIPGFYLNRCGNSGFVRPQEQ